MRYRFYTSTEKAVEAMRSAIETAREEVALEMYILEDDPTGRDFLEHLTTKALTGVRVFVILDAIGSFGVAQGPIERLRAAGADVRFFSHWLRRTHRKLLIIDRTLVFVGGVNIAKRFAPWKDLQVRLLGRTIGRNAFRSFARVYRTCGGNDPALLSESTPRLFKGTRLWFQEHGLSKRRTLRGHYELHIARAQRSIILTTPYLIPRRWLIACIHDALLRGVRVTIMVPEKTDHPIIDRANRHFLSLFSSMGATCLLGRGMNHSKLMLIDGTEATIGTHNLDALSFEWNIEASVFVEHTAMIEDLTRIVRTWERDALPFIEARDHSSFWGIPVRVFLSLFGSIL